MHKNDARLIQEIEEALFEEQEILLAANFEKLEDFLVKKQSLFEKIPTSLKSSSSVALKELEAMLKQNQRLYDASQRGLAAGKARLEEIRQVMGSLKTYSNEGQMKSEDTSPPTLSIKA